MLPQATATAVRDSCRFLRSTCFRLVERCHEGLTLQSSVDRHRRTSARDEGDCIKSETSTHFIFNTTSRIEHKNYGTNNNNKYLETIRVHKLMLITYILKSRTCTQAFLFLLLPRYCSNIVLVMLLT